jgi:hypothetical protein
VLVVSWKADAAAPFYSATHADPLGVTRKRTYECQGNTIIDFADVVFGQQPERADEFLERVLAQGRTGSMRDIVATIQAAQYDIIRAPLDQVLVIAGGPGTGKTVIALHRVSWLLSREEARLRPGDVLVVGPNTTFTRYIRNVLPDLGDSDVPIRDIAQLAPEVTGVGRVEAPEVAALKGDARMAGMLARSLEARIGEPEPVERLPQSPGCGHRHHDHRVPGPRSAVRRPACGVPGAAWRIGGSTCGPAGGRLAGRGKPAGEIVAEPVRVGVPAGSARLPASAGGGCGYATARD